MTESEVRPQSSAELLASYTRELILCAGKDGIGKSCALVSMAAFVAMMQPEAAFNVIDTEHKFGSALKSFGEDAPHNIRYFPCNDMNQVTAAARTVVQGHRPGDWLAAESMARIWERAQNLGYEAIAGVSKIEYLEMKENEVTPKGLPRKKSPIPDPDNFWQVVKGAHDAAFLDLICNCTDLNVMLTTTVKPPAKERQNREENKDRKILRAELGIDLNLDGAPRLPYYVETMVLMQMEQGKVSCRVLRDNNSRNENTRPTFDVPDRKSWAMSFMAACR